MDTDSKIKDFSEIVNIPVTRRHCTPAGIWQSVYSHPEIPFADILAEHIPDFVTSNPFALASVYIHEEVMYYGFVRIDDSDILLLGPIIEIPIDNRMTQLLLKSLGIPLAQLDHFIEFYEASPRYSIYKFTQIVTYLCNILNEEDYITPLNVLPEAYRRKVPDAVPDNSRKLISADEHLQETMRSETYERELYSYIYAGQYDTLKDFITTRTYTGESGKLASSNFRQNQYLVITSIAFASRAAVRGGLDYNVAMKQADFYYRKVDEAHTFNDLFDTHKQMLLTYAKLVADRKFGIATPPLFLYKVHDYIEKHITEKITTTDLAKAAGVSRSYLSSQFKKELNIELSDYISRLKIDEAKRLILTGGMPLIQIATTLGFSSQSHFAAIFKKMEHMTPMEFQKKANLS